MSVLVCFEDKGSYGFFYYESRDHQDCKRILLDWLQVQRIEALSEYRISGINRRADIYFHYQEQAYAFEVQLSHISSSVFNERTRDYEQAGIIPYWIGHGELKSRSHKIPFNILDECYIRHAPVPHAFYIDTVKESLFIRHSFAYEKHKSVRVTDTNGMHGLVMDDLKNPVRAIGKAVFFDEEAKRKWLQTTRYKRTKRYLTLNMGERFVLKLLQSYGQNLNYFPSICRVPLRNQFILRTHPEIWQTWFLLKVVMGEAGLNGTLSLCTAVNRLKEAVYIGVIQVREINNTMHRNASLAALAEEYLGWLVWIGVLTTRRSSIYCMKNRVNVRKTLETLLMDDEYVVNEVSFYLECRKE
ncbi:competence protein CoiA family protein [Salisediminibacterium selenitireducens]|nr:competence protein CoiA family protein [Salisediminibacterium selenitireducens]